jgi:hypothetical protein
MAAHISKREPASCADGWIRKADAINGCNRLFRAMPTHRPGMTGSHRKRHFAGPTVAWRFLNADFMLGRTKAIWLIVSATTLVGGIRELAGKDEAATFAAILGVLIGIAGFASFLWVAQDWASGEDHQEANF